MALTQMQLIQSLGEAMAWFERELNWGVAPTELRHLCGRIGELYAAVISNGQLATQVNQRGYDVVGADGERISVKTTAMMYDSGHVTFNVNTLSQVDRVIILRLNTSEMQVETLLDATVDEAIKLMSVDRNGKRCLVLGRLRKPKVRDIPAVENVAFDGYTVRELESGTIEVEKDGKLILPAKPVLRELANRLNLSILNSNGNPHNTRTLGSLVIDAVKLLDGKGGFEFTRRGL